MLPPQSMDLLLVYFVVTLAALGKSDQSHRKFGYKSEEQRRWQEQSAECGGSRQSPIHIVSHRAAALPLPALEKVHYHDLLPLPLCLSNTGHSVALASEAAFEGDEGPKGATRPRRPRVFGAVLDGAYELQGLHFHWGHRNSRGSEHVLSGLRFPLEMHLIHRKAQYRNVSEALQHPDGLAVLAFFFQARERSNPRLRPVVSLLRRLRLPGQRACLRRPFALAALLQDASDDYYYAYRGSLTTPPCSQAVVWIVVPDPLFASYRQIKWFRRLKSHEKEQMRNNYRFTQPLNNRIVYKRDPWKNNQSGNNVTLVHSLKWMH